MKVEFIPPFDKDEVGGDAEYLAKLAASVCVGRNGISEKGFKTAIDSNHLSLLEHLYLTFRIYDVSRITEVQQVRHRIASYSIKSGRHVTMTGEDWYITPESINKKFITRWLMKFAGFATKFCYNTFLRFGIPREDARYALLQAKSTDILVSMNARAFIEQCEKRLCNKAQWEIREMFYKMKESIKDYYPTVYALCNPPCVKDKCKEVISCKKK